MLFNYKAIDQNGEKIDGTIDTVSVDSAINLLQKRGLVISQIKGQDEGSILERRITLFSRVKSKDLVIVSRQIATLFQAQVSALRVFRLLATETESYALKKILTEISDDLQGGSSISKALEKHSDVFSEFYVNMVVAGEETGKLDETFNYLADYLDRTYEVTSKARNALIYPAFVIFTFVGVMVLMLTVIIPKISVIIVESGQAIPFYTQVVLSLSSFFVNYIFFMLALLIVGFILLARHIRTPSGKYAFDNFKLNIPLIGSLYRRLYLARFADTMHTMISSGISMVRAIEITTRIVDNEVYRETLHESLEEVRGGSSLSNSLSTKETMPGILVQMIKVGEETGELGEILKTLANFYRREVTNTVDTLVDLIEPILIVGLGIGVGVLLTSVLLPIYNIAGGF